MNIYGLVCTRNEADRYLRQVLAWHEEILDGIFVFDDQSTDATVRVAQPYADVWVRADEDPSFMEHEGLFRQAAWRAFELRMRPNHGDWILAFDADEFLVTSRMSERRRLEQLIRLCHDNDFLAAQLHFHEVFRTGINPAYRVDGFWGDIDHPRLFAYRPNGHYATNRPMGGGSVPTYVHSALPMSDPVFLHVGYAKEEDREAKYARYSTRLDNGHANSHIQSILEPPELVEWKGVVPW